MGNKTSNSTINNEHPNKQIPNKQVNCIVISNSNYHHNNISYVLDLSKNNKHINNEDYALEITYKYKNGFIVEYFEIPPYIDYSCVDDIGQVYFNPIVTHNKFDKISALLLRDMINFGYSIDNEVNIEVSIYIKIKPKIQNITGLQLICMYDQHDNDGIFHVDYYNK